MGRPSGSFWEARIRRTAFASAESMRERLALGPASRVVELASNDGYLLQFFRNAGIPVVGIEPAANVARVAEERGIQMPSFFGYMAWSGLILVPLFGLTTLVFFL